MIAMRVEWTPRRRRRLGRRIRIALDCTGATWERDGIDAAEKVLAQHWQSIEADYPADWVEIARNDGAL